MKVLALCGSLRAASMNAALLRATAQLTPAGITVEIFLGLARLPLFNPDLEVSIPEPVARLHAAIADCDALLISSPEYAHGVTAVIKNALDWLVSFEAFVDKPVAIFNASPRSVHADAALRETLITMSADLIVDACIALPLRSTGITEQAILESAYAAEIRRALKTLAAGVKR
jgi:chromate reductase, NAD(P)H dehydrogenase (quinone)